MKTSQPNKAIRIILIVILAAIQFSCTSRTPPPTDPNSIATIVAGTLSAIPSITPAPSFSSTPELPTVSPTATFALTVNGQLQGILAFIRNDNLWVSMNGMEHQLTTDAISTELPFWTGSPQLWYSNPQISPNGTQIAYLRNTYDVSTYSHTRTLIMSDVDGRNVRQLTNNDVAWVPPIIQWSNDSQQIFYLVSNGMDATSGLETLVVKSVNLATGDVLERGQFLRMVGCGGGSSDVADRISGDESIGRLGSGKTFALSPQNNYMIHPTTCDNGLGVLDLSKNQDMTLDEQNVSVAAISADGSRVAAISGSNIVIFNAVNGNIEKNFPIAEPLRTLLWVDNGTALFYSTSKPVGTQDLEEAVALEVFGSSPMTINLNLSTLWKLSLDSGESIKIIDMDAHDLKLIFATDQKLLVATIENTNILFDYLSQGNRENIAEHYPSVNLVEIGLAALTSNVIMHRTLQADYHLIK